MTCDSKKNCRCGGRLVTWFLVSGTICFLLAIIDHVYILGQYFAHGGTDQGIADAMYLHYREAERAADQRFERSWCKSQVNNPVCKKYEPAPDPTPLPATSGGARGPASP